MSLRQGWLHACPHAPACRQARCLRCRRHSLGALGEEKHALLLEQLAALVRAARQHAQRLMGCRLGFEQRRERRMTIAWHGMGGRGTHPGPADVSSEHLHVQVVQVRARKHARGAPRPLMLHCMHVRLHGCMDVHAWVQGDPHAAFSSWCDEHGKPYAALGSDLVRAAGAACRVPRCGAFINACLWAALRLRCACCYGGPGRCMQPDTSAHAARCGGQQNRVCACGSCVHTRVCVFAAQARAMYRCTQYGAVLKASVEHNSAPEAMSLVSPHACMHVGQA